MHKYKNAKMKFNINSQQSNNYLHDVKQILQQARDFAYSSVNSAMVQAYWFIGRRIVLEEQSGEDRAKYGKQIIKNISVELTEEFGKGFNEREIRKIRQFYNMFSIRDSLSTDSQMIEKNEITQLIFTRLSWTHIRHLLRVSDKEAQEYYIKETVANNWSTRTLDRNIASQYYERLLLSQTKEPVIEEMQNKNAVYQADKFEFIKNPAVLEFLNLPNNAAYTESELEKAIITDIQKFLLELGKGYAFVERQQLIRTDNRDYFIDLVFYNYILNCFVLIDLKTERITHQDIGQMDMYVRMYDENKKAENQNPTLGIVLCSETDADIARYSMLKGNEQIFATKYKLYLPNEEELKAEIERQKEILQLQLQESKNLNLPKGGEDEE